MKNFYASSSFFVHCANLETKKRQCKQSPGMFETKVTTGPKIELKTNRQKFTNIKNEQSVEKFQSRRKIRAGEKRH